MTKPYKKFTPCDVHKDRRNNVANQYCNACFRATINEPFLRKLRKLFPVIFKD